MNNGLAELLQLLNEYKIEYILVGGMAAVIHGAPISTQDIDIVHRRSPENIRRILQMLKLINAYYRGQPAGRILFPTKTALMGTGHNNLNTNLGPLDLLCELASGQGYEELLPYTETVSNSKITLPIISLKKLIQIKTELGRAKDQITIPLLMKLDE